jgi:RHS repeat-associated protein
MNIIGQTSSDTLKKLKFSNMSLEQAYPETATVAPQEIPQYGGEDPGGYTPQGRILYWYHPDYIQNVDLITDIDGAAYELFLYNPWGEQLHHWTSSSSSWTSPYRFNAKEQDSETGLAYYGARYYQSKLGVWLSVDPLAEEFPSWSSYNYALNNSIRFIDPDGRAAVDVIGDPPGKVIAVFYHGGATGGGNQTTAASAGHTGQIYSNTQSAVTSSGRDFTGIIIAPGLTSSSGVNAGMDFIERNYEDGDNVVIYGYSYGVDVAVDLTHSLNEAGINVDLLVTVDGSDGPLQNLTVNTTIPENVRTNLNIYQTSNSGASSSSRSTGSSSGTTSSSSGSNSSGSSNRSNSGSSNSPGSRGGPNRAVNPNSTSVINRNISGPGVNHGNIQQKAESTIQPLINTRIQNN